MGRLLLYIGSYWIFLLLSGCQLVPLTPSAPQDVAQLTHWQASGRFAYKTADNGGSASVRWQQKNDFGELYFSGPMGFGSATLRWQPGFAELITSKASASAPSAEALSYELTGLALPTDALLYWLRGLPWPHAKASLTRDTHGQPQRLTQLNWQLEYDGWQQIDGYWLPHRLKAKHNSDSFTFVIQHWKPNP